MIIVVGEVHFREGALDRLRPALVRLVEVSRALPGCLHYSQSVDVADPGLLIVTQRWEDADAMGAYYTSPALAEFGREVEDDSITHMSIKAYTAEYLRTMLAKEKDAT